MKKPRRRSRKIENASRNERRVREAAEGPMVAPTPELPDDMPIKRVLFSSRIQNALRAADLKTVGAVRKSSDNMLLSLQDFAKRLRRPASQDAGSAIDRWGKTFGQKAHLNLQ